ncbi:MAG: oligosaccharide flippase family protein [Candidatus Levyibacteriota bacterium]
MQYFTVFKNASYQTFARVLTSGRGFLLAVILARSFGAEGYGDFIKITSFVVLFFLFCDFGINAIFLQQKDSEKKFREFLYLRLAMALGLFLLANVISFFLPYDSNLGVGFSSFIKLGILIYSLELFIQSILVSTNAVFQKRLRYDFLMKSSAIGSLLSLILVFISASFQQSLHVIISALIFADLVAAFFSLLFVKEKIFPVKFDIGLTKELLKKSFPLGMVLVFNLIYFRIDTLIIAAFRSSGEVGIYGLAFLFFDFLLALPLFISNSIYPLLLAAKEKRDQFLKLTRSYFLIYLGLSFIVMIPFWFVSPLFNFINPQFQGAIAPFRILLLSLPFFFLTSFLQWILITFKRTGYLMVVYFTSMCLNVLLNLIFVPEYSYMAAAAITVISEALVFALLFYKVLSLKKWIKE